MGEDYHAAEPEANVEIGVRWTIDESIRSINSRVVSRFWRNAISQGQGRRSNLGRTVTNSSSGVVKEVDTSEKENMIFNKTDMTRDKNFLCGKVET